MHPFIDGGHRIDLDRIVRELGPSTHDLLDQFFWHRCSRHHAYIANIERALCELLEDPNEAAELTVTLVSFLHGNMLLMLCGAPESAPIERGRVLDNLLDRVLASVPHHRRQRSPR